MALEPVREVTGRGLVLPGDDVDTDQIIPGRFCKVVTFDGLAGYAFYDDRHDAEGNRTDHPFNDGRYRGARVLLAGRNFGCGSSREHAPQALYRSGIEAIVAESFAEIFFGNCTTLGIPCLAVTRAEVEQLRDQVRQHPETEIAVDVANRRVRAGSLDLSAHVPDEARQALLEGRWDPLGDLLDGREQVGEVYRRLPYPHWQRPVDQQAG